MNLQDVIEWLDAETLADGEVEMLEERLRVERANRTLPESTLTRVDTYLRARTDIRRVCRASVASALCMSTRTLARKLQAECTSFQARLDAERMRRCESLLRNDIDSATAIAESLGFSDTACFYKAFKKWTQSSFAEAKKSMARNDSDIGSIAHGPGDASGGPCSDTSERCVLSIQQESIMNTRDESTAVHEESAATRANDIRPLSATEIDEVHGGGSFKQRVAEAAREAIRQLDGRRKFKQKNFYRYVREYLGG